MNKASYPFKQTHLTRYTFTSIGRFEVEKVVEFTHTSTTGLYNIGFGDLLPDGSMDDVANTNNGDIIKVLATVVKILRKFTVVHPEAKIVFTGSTDGRTRLYRRILTAYYNQFTSEFVITAAFISSEGNFTEISFDPQVSTNYHFFCIQRII